METQWNLSGTSAEPQWKMLFVSCLHHDVDQHTVRLETTYFRELVAHLLFVFLSQYRRRTRACAHPCAITYR